MYIYIYTCNMIICNVYMYIHSITIYVFIYIYIYILITYIHIPDITKYYVASVLLLGTSELTNLSSVDIIPAIAPAQDKIQWYFLRDSPSSMLERPTPVRRGWGFSFPAGPILQILLFKRWTVSDWFYALICTFWGDLPDMARIWLGCAYWQP